MFEIIAAQEVLLVQILTEAALTPEQVVELMMINKLFNQVLKSPSYWQAMVKQRFSQYFEKICLEPSVDWFTEYQQLLDHHYQGLDRRTAALFMAGNARDITQLKALKLRYEDLLVKNKQDNKLINDIAKTRHQPLMDYVFNDVLLPHYQKLNRSANNEQMLLWVENQERQTLVHQAARLNQAAFIAKWPAFLIAIISNSVITAQERSAKPYTPAQLAALNGHVEVLDALITAGVRMNYPGSSDYTPFQCAVQQGQTEIMDYLHKKNIDIHAPRLNGMTPLLIAVKYGQLEAFKFLLNHDTSFSKEQFEHSNSLLHCAVQGGSDTIVELIIKNIKDLDLNARNLAGQTPLHLAAQLGRQAICNRLIAAGASVDVLSDDGNSLLHFAVQSANLRLVERIYKVTESKLYVHSRNKKGFTPLYEAVNTNTYLSKRAQRAVGAVVEFLIANGAGVNACATDPQTFVIETQKNITYTQNNETPLHAAARACNIAAMQVLLVHGANVNAQNHQGCTPLHSVLSSLLSEEAIFAAMDCLLLHDADIDMPTFVTYDEENKLAQDSHLTPIYYAMKKRYSLTVIEWLLNRGANPDISNAVGNTLLHAAVASRSDNLMKLLLARGANAHIVNHAGLTPLAHLLDGKYVTSRNLERCFHLLINYGGMPIENELSTLKLLALYDMEIKKRTLFDLLSAMQGLEVLDLSAVTLYDEPGKQAILLPNTLPKCHRIIISGLKVENPMSFMRSLILAAPNLSVIEDDICNLYTVLTNAEKQKLFNEIYQETKHPIAESALTFFGTPPQNNEKRSLEEADDSSAKRQKKRN